MLRTLALVAFAALFLANATFAAGDYGTAEEAKAMLDKAKALEMFNKPDGRFRDAISMCSAPTPRTASRPPARRPQAAISWTSKT